MKQIFLFLAIVITLAFLLLFLWFIPKWQLASLPPLIEKSSVEIEKRIELENKVRTTWAQILGGIVVFLGIYFTWQTLYVNREGQITERFTRAIDQLGNRKLEVRLGGIYALERIARDSAKDHWSIMEVLTTYVRENAPWPPKEDRPKESHLITQDQIPREFLPPMKGKSSDTEQKPKPKTDIQAILTILGRRRWTHEEEKNQRLNLARTDLRGTDLRLAHLKIATFIGANLEWADLERVNLEGAELNEANLKKAFLYEGDLKGVNLYGANLERATLSKANLGVLLNDANLENSANLRNANLKGALFICANLEKALLSEANLEEANLSRANLKKANFFNGANLEEADLGGADLEEVLLGGVILKKAFLGGTNLKRAILSGTNLKDARFGGTDLTGADLTDALGLTKEQVELAIMDEKTKLPDYLKTPAQAEQKDKTRYRGK